MGDASVGCGVFVDVGLVAVEVGKKVGSGVLVGEGCVNSVEGGRVGRGFVLGCSCAILCSVQHEIAKAIAAHDMTAMIFISGCSFITDSLKFSPIWLPN
jgi:hypothetical protein